jgi:hypothetical protein
MSEQRLLGQSMNFAQSLFVFSVLALVVFLVWNRIRADLERCRLRLDTQAQLLEKVGPGQVLTNFLKTDEGKHFSIN